MRRRKPTRDAPNLDETGSAYGGGVGRSSGQRDVRVNRLDEVGERDGWRCWLCDEPVDPDMSVNDPRGPSIDLRSTATKAKAKAKRSGASVDDQERLAHRGCNTGKGATTPVIAWPEHLFVVDPAPIIASAERLERKGGREVMARCPSQADADEAAEWLLDRLSRLHPGLELTAQVEPGGGQFVLVLRA
jgi:hypothetical protein